MRRHLTTLAIVAAIAAGAFARPDAAHSTGAAPDDARPIGYMDEKTGRDLLNYPPSPQVAYDHMALKIDIPDMNVPRMNIVQSLSFSPVSRALDVLELDAKLLEVQSVSLAHPSTTKVSFKNNGQKLALFFDPPLPVGEKAEVLTTYTVNDPPQGIIWTPESPAWPGRPAQLHSQGESSANSYWFPCHDFPNIKLATEISVTVPDGFQAVSNGKLVETIRPQPGQPPRVTYHWRQDKPHSNYLVCLAVGKFDLETLSGGKSGIPMTVYAPLGRAKDVKPTFGNTPRMIDLFARRTGQPYPWDKYSQTIVWNFGPGGMENTSATTLFDTAILSPEGLADGDLDGLISHELAHQWFGDLITCKSWEHIWLNEGFATYFTNLWWEERDGQDAYLAGVLATFDRVTAADKADAPFQPAMVSKEYKHPGDAFSRAANPYPKGASILHMLRQKIGDELFFKGLAAYVDAFKFKTAETADFRRSMEDASGESLDRFFTQWCFHPGVPQLDIACDWNAESKELVVKVDQKQTIDGYNPAFAFSLPIWAEPRSGGTGRFLGSIEVSEKLATTRFKLDADPIIVAIDPQLAVLSQMTITQPLTRWMAQLERGPTIASRIQAARALGHDQSSIAGNLLLQLAAESKRPDPFRIECIKALSARHDAARLADLSRNKEKSRLVREALAEAAASALQDDKTDRSARATLTSFIIAAARNDESSRVRAAALKAIGKTKMTDQRALLESAVTVESQSDRIRQGALEALGDLGAPEGLPIAIRYAKPGTNSRTRPVAIDAVVKLAHHDLKSALPALEALLRDREARTSNAAGEAVSKLGNPAALEKLLSEKRDAAERERIEQWISTSQGLRSAPGTPSWIHGDKETAWFPILSEESWTSSDDEKAQLKKDAAAYFQQRGYIAERRPEGIYILCWDIPAWRMTQADGHWTVVGADVEKAAGQPALFFKLDDAGAKLLAALTAQCIGKNLAVLVDDHIYLAPRLQSKLSSGAAITGQFKDSELMDLRHTLTTTPALSLRVTVDPGELPGEQALRDACRKAERK